MSADTEQAASTGPATGTATPTRGGTFAHRLAGRSGLGAAVGGCLLGAVLALLAASATWVHTGVRDAATAASGATVAPLAVKLSGGDLAPAISAFGLLGLATAVALVATRGVARRVVGLLVAAAGVGVIIYAARVGLDPGPVVRSAQPVIALAPSGHPSLGPIRVSAAPWLALVGGLALLGAGLLAAAFGRAWPAMGGRYQTRSPRPLDAWEAIERGQDPTVTAD
jgi:uncharacterized membrane protein (TIGR02234 family)